MEYAGYVLRQERLARNWSQEGLCKGICTVSYLSKIEQGKAEPSPEILHLLMERMQLPWYSVNAPQREFIEQAYESLFSFEDRFYRDMEQADRQVFQYSDLGLDFLILEQFTVEHGNPLAAELEPCLSNRQLALQRILQERYTEAVSLCPRAYLSYCAGAHFYQLGQVSEALETLQSAYQIAAREGNPRIMLHCQLLMGNCYSNQHNPAAMDTHYQIARRLATALNDTSVLASIAYNTAATQIETGHYAQALSYFQTISDPSRMDLHKLAICYEKLGMLPEAQVTVNRARERASASWLPAGIEDLLLDVVQFRLSHPDYVHCHDYGTLLLHCFQRCRQELPSGYAVFHLPWVLEWYEENRQYKQALQLLKHFPQFLPESRFTDAFQP